MPTPHIPTSAAPPYTHPSLAFETAYPNALDTSTLRSATEFHNTYASTTLSPSTWRSRYAPPVASWTDWALVQARIDDETSANHGKFVGQCVVCKWDIPGPTAQTTDRSEDPASSGISILFILALIVDSSHRRTGVASSLLRAVADERPLTNGVTTIGIVHGHPAALRAVGMGFGGGLKQIRALGKLVPVDEAAGILAASNVPWLKESEVGVKLMDEDAVEGLIDSRFVDAGDAGHETGQTTNEVLDSQGQDDVRVGEDSQEKGEWLLLFRI